MAADPNKTKRNEQMAIDAAMPTHGLTRGQYAEVYHGQTIDGVTLQVEFNELVGAEGGDPDPLPATDAIVSNGQTVSVRNSTGAVTNSGSAAVAANNLGGVDLPATVAMVSNSASISVLPATGTSPGQGSATTAVSAGVISGVRLPATAAVVSNGQTFAVDGGEISAAVVGNAVTFTFTPAGD